MKNVKEIKKICILGDTHFGVRSDSKSFHEYYQMFYNDIFFPYLLEHNITEIYQLGDLFDRRKYINFLTLSESRSYFFDKIKQYNMHLHILVGNHDIFWKESLSVNSPSLLLKDYENITIYDEFRTVQVGNIQIDIIPWVCNENEESFYNFINKTTSDICFGHFEISGFQMYKGVECSRGLSANIFKQYSHVFSGHYHHKSSSNNIYYVGTPCEHTWADFDDPRGFHLLDTSDLSLEFIKNPFTIFEKVYYDDTKELVDPRSLTGKFVKVIVVNKTDFYKFDQYIDSIYRSNPHELKIIENFSEFEADVLGVEEINLEDTQTLLFQYVDGLDTSSDKTKVKTLLNTLYVEAQNWGDK